MSNRAGGVRVARPLFQEAGGGSIPTSALSLVFDRCGYELFKQLNKKWHSQLPLIGASRGRVFYSAEFCGVVYAVSMWSNPVARMLPQLEWLELRRFAIAPDAPRNTASRMLSWMKKDIKKRFPDVVKLISYQDIEVHTGGIYKASGWKEAKGYKPSSTGGKGWASRNRIGQTGQPLKQRMRWELLIREEECD